MGNAQSNDNSLLCSSGIPPRSRSPASRTGRPVTEATSATRVRATNRSRISRSGGNVLTSRAMVAARTTTRTDSTALTESWP